jgi:DNA-binding ferritin-like protein
MADTFTAPQAVADNAQRALDVRAQKPESQRGMTPVGLARANQLAKREPISLETVRRMVAYFDRHEVDKEGATWDEQGKGWQAWYGWGGDEGRAWARRILEENTVESKASRRHSAGDMTLIRTARKNLMDTLNVLVELGDDGEDVVDATEPMAIAADPMKRYAIKDIATSAVLTQLLAQTVNLFYTASAAHWNVTSLDFPQYHAFFEMVYEAMEEEIDNTAEFIRSQGAKTPTSLGQLLAMCNDYPMSADADVMTLLACIDDCNANMLATIGQGIAVAGMSGEYAAQNYLQERMGLSQKLAWMLRSALEGEPNMIPTMGEASDVMAEMMTKAAADRNTTQAERQDMPAEDFVFPETRNFPVVTPTDIPAAVSSWGRYGGTETFETFKANLIALAKRKGQNFVDALPKEWLAEMEQKSLDGNAIMEVSEDVKALARRLLGEE